MYQNSATPDIVVGPLGNHRFNVYSCRRIILTELGMKKFSAKWVPHIYRMVKNQNMSSLLHSRLQTTIKPIKM